MRKNKRAGVVVATVVVLILSMLGALYLSVAIMAADTSVDVKPDTSVITIEDQQVPLAGNVIIDESASKDWLWLVLIGGATVAAVSFHLKGKAENVEDVLPPEDVE